MDVNNSGKNAVIDIEKFQEKINQDLKHSDQNGNFEELKKTLQLYKGNFLENSSMKNVQCSYGTITRKTAESSDRPDLNL